MKNKKISVMVGTLALVACIGSASAFAAEDITNLSNEATIEASTQGVEDTVLTMGYGFELVDDEILELTAQAKETTKPEENIEIDPNMQINDGIILTEGEIEELTDDIEFGETGVVGGQEDYNSEMEIADFFEIIN